MNRFVKITALALGTMLLASNASFAFNANSGSADDRSACTPDAFRLCGSAIPDANRVAACLKASGKKLSPACHKVMFHK